MFTVEKERVFLEEEGKIVAEINWVFLEEKVIDVNRTFVDESQRGKGLAEKLVLAVIEIAKKEELKIVPSCSYVENYFNKHEELSSLLVTP
ncbi:N-acetyltransferase [Vagococcus sp. DIV0080]|uniref:N-acetyltransferase n=1 Tax=Candidatus Vagococcus giribetii TaxID=2230876 RepID=A0ABS3HTR7_9ENTE|nr:GNAT family N-acetyltransferase [Vagococcus sp. DIV0080]MBO0476568.1 N-acetyltransferase [Vagococcus sp. DIV0080]